MLLVKTLKGDSFQVRLSVTFFSLASSFSSSCFLSLTLLSSALSLLVILTAAHAGNLDLNADK